MTADRKAVLLRAPETTPGMDIPLTSLAKAAANALSDIYAMGARPLSALSFVAWPVARLGLGPLGR